MPLSPAPPGSFTIAVLPDTQGYPARHPEIFYREIEWILTHCERQRIVFVSHVGDLVEDNALEQWPVAVRAMSKLDGVLPYGISPGNNDMDAKKGDSSLFRIMFPARHFEGRPWYGGHFHDNANSYQLLDLTLPEDAPEGWRGHTLQFVLLHLECNAPDDRLAWADRVLRKHARRQAIITAHMFLGPIHKPQRPSGYFTDPKGVMQWVRCHSRNGNTPQQLWDKCFRRHPNVILILAGDQSRTQALHLTLTGDAGNPVHACMSDYRDGWFRLYRFLPDQGVIRVIALNAVTGMLCQGTEIVPDKSAHQFTLPWTPNNPS
jgi:hypothetical protein